MTNLNYLFYNKYYGDVPAQNYSKYNFDLTESSLLKDCEIQFTEYSFKLKTSYPGLLFGLGYYHAIGDLTKGDVNYDTNEANGAFKTENRGIALGFTLDYASGMPVIPGSTVKGVLRSAFKKYPDAIPQGICADMKKIFGSDEQSDNNQRGACVFFDAIPIYTSNTKKENNGGLLDIDYITPQRDPLADPIPLPMLKVVPGVTYLFRFGLSEYSDNNEKRVRLLNLFEDIIAKLGVGAKTNVGYGAMAQLEKQPDVESGLEQGRCQYPGYQSATGRDKHGDYYEYCYMHSRQKEEEQKKQAIQDNKKRGNRR